MIIKRILARLILAILKRPAIACYFRKPINKMPRLKRRLKQIVEIPCTPACSQDQRECLSPRVQLVYDQINHVIQERKIREISN